MTSEPRLLAGRYRVDELIGRGGMASVYRGYDTTLDRVVALKILRRELAEDSAFRTRFRQEAQSASRMAHPAVVRVYDAGEDTVVGPDGAARPEPFIVMELVHGRTLQAILASGPLAPDQAVRYVDGILEALQYSHRAGVVHRDIKPGNVMVTDSGRVKVMDFGIARAASDSSSTVAETSAILGTAAYFSPEQAKGEPVDARADLYSTGVVLYELLTGRPPFRGESPVAVAYQHVSEAPVPPGELAPDVPPALDAVVLRALAKDPYQRFQDASSFRDALREALTGRAPTARELRELSSDLYGPSPRQAAETARSLRQLATDTTMRRTQSGPPVAWIWAGVAVLAVLLGSVLFWVVTIQPREPVPNSSRIVPDVVTMSYDRAERVITDTDLVAVRRDVSDAAVPAGSVVRTDPPAGTSVAPGGTVTIFVSTGVRTVPMPTVAGLPEQGARDALTAAGLRVGTITPRNDPDLAAGTVIEAATAGGPAPAGEPIAVGSTVDLTVASGKVVLNDLSGYTVARATADLEALGLRAATQENPSCTATQPPTVTVMSVAPGEVPIHSEVVLTYCSGP